MSTELIKAYCEKPHSFLKDILTGLGLSNYDYKTPEIEKIVSEIRGDFESKLWKREVAVEPDFDIFQKSVVDGAYLYPSGRTTVIRLSWDNPERIDAEVWFDKTRDHPPEEYKGLKEIMREHDFHILKQKD